MLNSVTVFERFLRRLLSVTVTFILSLCFIWLALRILPGDSSAYLLGDGVNDSVITEEMGLSEFLARALTFSFGPSAFAGKSVTEVILERLVPTLGLAIMSLAIAVVITVMMLYLDKKHGMRKTFETVSLLSFTVPAFISSLLLMLFSSRVFGYFPSYSSEEPFLSALFPAITLAFMHTGLLMKTIREMEMDEEHMPYVKFALSKGASENRVTLTHVLANISPGIMVLLDQSFISLFASSAAVETLFSYPGLGSLMVTAIARRDTGTIAGMMIITVMLSSALSIAEDIVLAVLDVRRGCEETP
ncbi:MAG: ABC transporter permease [Bullifex sp.]